MEQIKSRKQSHKHSVSFEEAETVFGDSLARIFDDEEPSFDEKRNKIIGHLGENRF
jgi:uncharacterized DUF497 family protein